MTANCAQVDEVFRATYRALRLRREWGTKPWQVAACHMKAFSIPQSDFTNLVVWLRHVLDGGRAWARPPEGVVPKKSPEHLQTGS